MILKTIADLFAASGEFTQYRDHPTGSPLSIEGIAPSSFALITASIYHARPAPLLVIVKNYQRMQELYTDLSCFVDGQDICLFPPGEILPYEFVSPSEKIERDRITTIYSIIHTEKKIIIATVESLMRKIPRRDFYIKKGFTLAINEEYPFDDLIELLVAYGYTREYKVESFGQFAVKGGIIDVYLSSLESPVRLDFFGDTLESIREFDPESQVSQGDHREIIIYPRREMVLSASELQTLAAALEKAAKKGLEIPEHGHADDIHRLTGIDDLFPLVVPADTLVSYFDGPLRPVCIETAELLVQADQVKRTFSEIYAHRHTKALCLPPDELIDDGVIQRLAQTAVELRVFTATSGALNWKLRSIPNYHGKIAPVREELKRRLDDGWRLVITTGFEGQARRLFDIFNEFKPANDFDHIDLSRPLSICISPLREGCELVQEKILLLTDHEIFGKTYRKKSQFKKKKSRPIDTFLELKAGDYMVHVNHGIGIFRGIERMAAGGVERDFLLIEYSEGDKLYVSLDQITMVQKYIGLEGRPPRIDALGKKSAWNRIKERVQQAVEEIARDLTEIYARRKALRGHAFPPDTMWQEEFESKFEYEETPDQITAIEDVKDDMEADRPMDRLVCGDVGFGKTEVAIRAAFKAVMAGKQVAILVPTTVLALQHYNTFTRRFADYPITIDMLSRFKTAGENAVTRKNLGLGTIDIVIGTHALLSKDIVIKNLGLLIIDEEQRFGVKHKEQLKKLKTQVDVLTLSATPIPRTLHMALAGIRDLSIIATPPENRQSIETYVIEENPDIMRMAIINEIERGGQVFFVHNRVETIDAEFHNLKKLVPEASICVAHGQMHDHELEQIFVDFLGGRYQVLIATTIIESGLDMPSVNTIIINRADTFGLSQLYQLKGRVGRSAAQAYAYLFYPKHVSLSETAEKRLQVIAEYAEIGSGFKIAMKDLEIRGSGNILGREQSGNIMEVGFDLYCQMLEDAVRRIKGEKPLVPFRTPVFVNSNFFIPETYMGDEKQKIEFYKRFESCETAAEVEEIEKEMIDRFGPPPGEVAVLVELEKIRAIASALFIEEVVEDSKGMRVRFSANSAINIERVLSTIKKDKRISVDPKDPEIVHLALGALSSEKKLVDVKKWLQQIS